MNKFYWNLKQNEALITFDENAFENNVCEMTEILARGDELIAR